MSGGGMDYACYEMREGETAKFRDYASNILEVLREALACVEASSIVNHVALVALPAVISRAERAVELIARHRAEEAQFMVELADIARACEWKCSGDWGTECVVEAAMEWCAKRLGGSVP